MTCDLAQNTSTPMFFVKEQDKVQNSELLNPALKFGCFNINANHFFWSDSIFNWCYPAKDELVRHHLCHTIEIKTHLLPFGTG